MPRSAVPHRSSQEQRDCGSSRNTLPVTRPAIGSPAENAAPISHLSSLGLSSPSRQGGAALRLEGSIPSPLRAKKSLHSGRLDADLREWAVGGLSVGDSESGAERGQHVAVLRGGLHLHRDRERQGWARYRQPQTHASNSRRRFRFAWKGEAKASHTSLLLAGGSDSGPAHTGAGRVAAVRRGKQIANRALPLLCRAVRFPRESHDRAVRIGPEKRAGASRRRRIPRRPDRTRSVIERRQYQPVATGLAGDRLWAIGRTLLRYR
jgi:hypothetical protein